ALANEVRSCAHWVAPTVGRPKPVAAAGLAPVLVLSTTGDAATPLVNAVKVAAELPAAGLVTAENEGHTAYGRSFCVDSIVADYFETGRVPEEVHRC
ncbi:MAG: alpha/beta hydrolase, partial [Acidimicrobiales bacterium]